MAGWLERFSLSKPKSAEHAKERLRLVLIHDRTDLTPYELEALKNDLLEVICKYVEIDSKGAHISVAQDGREQRLVADIPIAKTRKRRSG
ncbi:MAG: cell division topological specificity factor MinE [Anaerolineales bacterium]